ncbi:hypothetical protein NEOLEDRAFT_1132404 [Neolentinus lepideus HHB14362 ss-1]|uniref:ferric-chelate reductase (NADPH) n=1 Tax=Neolentinus lepideus HHB14362 ss-1 TaxID=1314782 RepID=A0A165T9X2_9AGAM|nr:hypothetical protein NEOLEDRAFT_1132404 [Neolentinus lepideus HHB14362 ss-1]
MSAPTSTLTPNPTTPSYPDNVEWITAYLTIHMLSIPSRRYAYLLWIVVVFFFLLFAVLHWTGSRGGSLGAYWSRWALRRRTWRKKGKIVAASKKGVRAQPMPMSSNAQILCLTVIVLGSLALCFAGPDYIAPGTKVWQFNRNSTNNTISRRAYDTSLFTQYQPQYTIPKAWWTSGGRTGLIAFALFPLCILFALKAPPFAIFAIPFMIQLHFDKLAWLHRWVGRLIWFITALHVALWSVQLVRDHRSATGEIAYTYAWQYEKFIYGWIAFGVMTLLMLCSVQPLRRSHYEAFYFLHILLAPLTIIMSALHHPPVWIWCWVALALWGCERLWRATWWLSTNGYFGSSVRAPPAEEKMSSHRSFGKKAEKADMLRPTPFPPPVVIPAASASQQTLIGPPASTLTSVQVKAPPSAYKAPHLPAVHHGEDPQPQLSYPPSEHSTYPPSTSRNNSSVDFASIAPPTVYSYVPPPGYAHAELLAGMTVRLRFITPGYLSWAPGQHFLITVPAISRFCTHPFTCASICDEQAPSDGGREIVLLIRAKNGWTRDLWDEIVAMSAKGLKCHPSENPPVGNGEKRASWHLPDKGVLLKVLVDGPFGSAIRARWGENSTAVIVAGGSGVSFGMSVLEYLCLCMAGRDGKFLGGRPGGWGKKGFRLRRIRFVWLVREFSHIQWCASVLRRCMAMIPEPDLRVDIFVTNAKTALDVRRAPLLSAQAQPKGASTDFLVPPTPQYTRQGRSRSGSTSSDTSVESEDDAAGNEYVDLSYYTGDYANEEAFSDGELGEINVVDLTNFDGDDDTVLPGEAQFSKRVKKEGKVRRRQSRKISTAMLAKLQLEDRATEERRRRHRDNRVSASSTDKLLSPVLSPVSPVRDRRMSIGSSQFSLGYVDVDYGPGTASSSASPLDTIHNPVSPNAFSPSSVSAVRIQDPIRPASDWDNQTTHGSIYAMMPTVGTGSHGEQVKLDVDAQEIRDIGIVSEHAWPGRPKLERILADEVEASKGSVIVGCCGPISLNAVIRKAIGAQINPARIRRGDMRGMISLVSEEFEY